jgi:hypothetical protein
MNAFRNETASLIAADPRLASLSTRFTTGSAPFPAIRVGVPCLRRSLHLHLARSSKLKLHPAKSISFGFPPQQNFDFVG